VSQGSVEALGRGYAWNKSKFTSLTSSACTWVLCLWKF